MKEVRYYKSFDQDFVESNNQEYILKDNYKWIHNNIFHIILSYLAYYFILFVAFIYNKFVIKVKIRNKKIIKGYKRYYIYANHTMELGDVFNPPIVTFPKRPYIICSPANLGIPFLGKILPFAGALPIPSSISKMKEFREAISKRNIIIIYPEAHVWPYCTFIRDFNTSSFHYPVEDDVPVFTSTTVYKKGRGKKPKIEIILDGPFVKDNSLTRKENIKKIHDEVFNSLVKNSKENEIEIITYKKED